MPDKSGYKHCTDPTHEKSVVNGRCLTCRNAAIKRWREKKKQGRPRVAQIVQGKPCAICGETERYAIRGKCVRCQRAHGQRYRGAVITHYGVPQEFTRWVTSPALELVNV